MAIAGLPADPTDSRRFKVHRGKSAFQCFYLDSWSGLTLDQIRIMRDVWPHFVDERSLLIVEELPGDLRKLTFTNENTTIICDPRERELRVRARESLLRAALKPLELTTTKTRSLIARTMRYLNHHGYM